MLVISLRNDSVVSFGIFTFGDTCQQEKLGEPKNNWRNPNSVVGANSNKRKTNVMKERIDDGHAS